MCCAPLLAEHRLSACGTPFYRSFMCAGVRRGRLSPCSVVSGSHVKIVSIITSRACGSLEHATHVHLRVTRVCFSLGTALRRPSTCTARS